MKNQTYTCAMIADLIPLYAEGLCSEESRAAVEAHIAECEECRKLCEAAPAQTASAEAPLPDETKVFKKVSRKMKKNKWLNWILVLLLAVIICIIGYLSCGQITKDESIQSFDTVFESFRVRKLAKQMGRGDFSTFVDVMSYDQYGRDMYTSGLASDMCEKAETLLTDSFAETFGDTKLKSVKVKSNYYELVTYGDVYSEKLYRTQNRIIGSEATLEFEDGRFLRLSFMQGADGGYVCDANEVYNSGATIYNGMPQHHSDDPDDRNKFCEAMFYLNDPDILAPRGWMEKRLLGTPKAEKEQKTAADSISMRFSETVRGRIYENVLAFKAKYSFTSVTVSHMQFDYDKKELFWTMTLEAADEKGKAVMLTRFTRDLTGLIPQDAALNTVYTDGCTPELAEALRTFFSE